MICLNNNITLQRQINRETDRDTHEDKFNEQKKTYKNIPV